MRVSSKIPPFLGIDLRKANAQAALRLLPSYFFRHVRHNKVSLCKSRHIFPLSLLICASPLTARLWRFFLPAVSAKKAKIIRLHYFQFLVSLWIPHGIPERSESQVLKAERVET
jgi:hypothetical protein